MKNLSFIALLVAVLLCSCSTKKAEKVCKTAENYSICGKWELTKINDKDIIANENEEQPFVIFNMKDSTIAAFDGCNNIGGWVVKADSGDIVMVDMTSTLQFCEGQGESAMLGAILNVADKYEIKECAEQGKCLVITSSSDSTSAIFKAVEVKQE